MKILVVGGGGREHALCWKILQNERVTRVYCAPGNAGIEQIAQCVDIAATDITALADFAEKNAIDLTVGGMEDPLVLGLADEFHRRGLKIFGPNKAAAEFEGSKVYAKDFMKKYGIPTAAYETFRNMDDAKRYAENAVYPMVVKADGLAVGKGVTVCEDFRQAQAALSELFLDRRFGASGDAVVIEEFMSGREVSVLCFCDGENIVPMESATDYKRAFDGDRGPNTGGMGCISPSPFYSEQAAQSAMDRIFRPTIAGMAKEGRPFVGCLFVGLMMTEDGPKVIEYNCRFGDPETQTVLPRLGSNFVDILLACVEKKLDKLEIKWKNNAVCCVIGVPQGYPDKYKTGAKIKGLDMAHNNSDTLIFHAGTKKAGEDFETSGGRAFAVCGIGRDLSQAREKTYGAMEKISSDGIYYRKDIGS